VDKATAPKFARATAIPSKRGFLRGDVQPPEFFSRHFAPRIAAIEREGFEADEAPICASFERAVRQAQVVAGSRHDSQPVMLSFAPPKPARNGVSITRRSAPLSRRCRARSSSTF
jgi:hypothetical protein